MKLLKRVLIEIAAAALLVICISASSAAFAAGKPGRSADGLSCGFTVPQNASPARFSSNGGPSSIAESGFRPDGITGLAGRRNYRSRRVTDPVPHHLRIAMITHGLNPW